MGLDPNTIIGIIIIGFVLYCKCATPVCMSSTGRMLKATGLYRQRYCIYMKICTYVYVHTSLILVVQGRTLGRSCTYGLNVLQ